MDKLFGGGLAVGASNADEGDGELPTMVSGKLLKGGEHIGHHDQRAAPCSRAWGAKALPSKVSPLKAKKRQPGVIRRESVVTVRDCR